MLGLVLTAGGARGAYQAGVLKRVAEIPALKSGRSPFPIVAGSSAGAINGAAVAAYSEDFVNGVNRLAQLWGDLTVKDVFRSDPLALLGNAARMLLDFGLGPILGAGRTQSLVDSAPLHAFLQKNLPLDRIDAAIRSGTLYAVAITATGYHSGKAFTFVHGQEGHPLWSKSRRVALSMPLSVEHVLASAAIPIIFPPVALPLGGSRAWFGDGALRLVTPLSPAIRLGAERLFAIGVRCQDSADDLLRSELAAAPLSADVPNLLPRPPLSQICGVFMNAIFLDHLDADVDHLRRMNRLISAKSLAPGASAEPAEIMRPIEATVISPSEDVAVLAKTLAHRMPRSIRLLLDGLGTPDARSADLMSYLLFDSAYTRELIQLGYRDAHQRIDEIEACVLASDATAQRRRSRLSTKATPLGSAAPR